MKSAISFLIILLMSLSIRAQEVEVNGIVLDLGGKALEGALILDSKGKMLCDPTGPKGEFSFIAVENSLFAVEKPGYELKWSRVVGNGKLLKVILDIKSQEFEEIVITRQNSEEALDISNVNILDYQPLNNCILTLKKEKKTYYIGLDSLRRAGVSYPLEIERPRSLFIDCMKNAYILSSDSAYQFYLVDEGIIVLPPITLINFDRYIRPCVSRFNDRLVFESLSELNKSYELVMYDSTRARSIFSRKDLLGYQAAWEASVRLGQISDPVSSDTILTDPEYTRRQARRELYGRNDVSEDFHKALSEQYDAQIHQSELAQNRDSSYKVSQRKPLGTGANDHWRSSGGWSADMASFMLYTQPIQIKTFQIGQYIAIVDYLLDSVLLLDHQGFLLKANAFEVESDIKDVMQDRATGFIYLYTMDHGDHKIYGLNALNGEVHYLKNFGGLPQTENSIIYDGYLYYKVLDRDFYGLERVKLPFMSFFEE